MVELVNVGALKKQQLTLPWAAVFLGQQPGQMRKVVDRGGLRALYLQEGKRRIRALDGIDILFLRLAPPFSPKIRRELYRILKAAPDDQPLSGNIPVRVDGVRGSGGVVEVPVGRIAEETLTGLKEAEKANWEIDTSTSGGVIRGTDVEAYRIAALVASGTAADEVLQDYPNLTLAQVRTAVDYAAAHPKRGRPYPARTAKSVLAQGRGGLKRAFAAARDGE